MHSYAFFLLIRALFSSKLASIYVCFFHHVSIILSRKNTMRCDGHFFGKWDHCCKCNARSYLQNHETLQIIKMYYTNLQFTMTMCAVCTRACGENGETVKNCTFPFYRYSIVNFAKELIPFGPLDILRKAMPMWGILRMKQNMNMILSVTNIPFTIGRNSSRLPLLLYILSIIPHKSLWDRLMFMLLAYTRIHFFKWSCVFSSCSFYFSIYVYDRSWA